VSKNGLRAQTLYTLFAAYSLRVNAPPAAASGCAHSAYFTAAARVRWRC